MLNLKNKKILIYGFGISGKSCFNFLNKTNYLYIFDDKLNNINQRYKKKIINFKQIPKALFDYVIISPGIDFKKCRLKKYLIKNYEKIISDFDVFYFSNPDNKLITITGTNGKSTTAKLIYDILKICKSDVRLVGNIGKPILNEKRISKKTIFVVEASSYQIQYSKYFKTDVAIFLNIHPDHLERHETFLNYFNAKFQIIKNLKKNGFLIIPKKNKIIKKALKTNKLKKEILICSANISKKILQNINNKYFTNKNNQENLCFALKLAHRLKCSQKNILKAVNSFNPLPFRNQLVFNNKKISIINDSKSTSFSSSINLLKSYKNIYWLVGGIAKKNDKLKLERKYYKNIKAYIYGRDKFFFQKKFKNKIKFKYSNHISGLTNKIIYDIKNEEKKINIIFSPAAASFDQFSNFEERGKHFNKIIKKNNYFRYAK